MTIVMVLHDLKMYDLRYLRTCTSAGEPLHTKTAQLWKEGTGLTIREGFGQTETVCMIGNFVGEKIREGAMGKASPGWNISIHDDDGNPLPDEDLVDNVIKGSYQHRNDAWNCEFDK